MPFEKELIDAAISGDLAKVKEALSKGANINAVDTTTYLRRSALSAAVLKGHIEIVKYLLEQGADVCLHDKQSSILYDPVISLTGVRHDFIFLNEEKAVQLTKLLLEYGADPNAQGSDWSHGTAFGFCIVLEQPKIAKLMLQAGGNKSIKDDNNNTPAGAVYGVIYNAHHKLTHEEAMKNEKRREIFFLLQDQAVPSYDKSYNIRLERVKAKFENHKRSNKHNMLNLESLALTADLTNPLESSVKNWITSLPSSLANDKDVKPLIERTFQASLQELSQQQSDKPVNALQLDIQVIDKTFNNLTKEALNNLKLAQALPKFAKHAESVIQQHQAQATALAKQLADTSNPLASQVKNLALTLQRSNVQVSTWSGRIQEAVRDPLKLPKLISTIPVLPTEVKNVFDAVNRFTGKVEQVLDISKQFFQTITNATNLVDDTWKKVQESQKKLNDLINAPSTDEFKIAEAKVELKLAESKLGQQQSALDDTLKNLGKGIGLAGALASMFGDPKLGQQIVKIGTAAISIVQSITTIMQGGSILGPIGIIGGAVVSILNVLGVFGNDTPSLSPEQQIMQELSQQICKLGEYLDKRLDHIENMIDCFYQYAVDEFRRVKNGLIDLKLAAEKINKRMEEINSKLDIGFIELYNQTYDETRSKALHLERYYKSDPKKLEKEAVKCAQALTYCATVGAASSIITGFAEALNTTEVSKAISKTNGVAFIINLLAQYARYINAEGGYTNTKLVNPIVWADAISTYLKMLQDTPLLTVSWDYQAEIKDMIEAGKKINQFISCLQSDKVLFGKLCQNYREKLKSALGNFKLLEELGTAYQLLIIFSSLAFPKTYQEDLAFVSKLQLKLYSQTDLEKFMNEATDKQLVISAIEQNAVKAIDELELQLLTMVAEAQRKPEKESHPMVDKVIAELELFKICYIPCSAINPKDEKETPPKPSPRNTIVSVPTTVQTSQAPVSLEKSKDEKKTAPKLPSWRNTIGSGSVPTTVQIAQALVSLEKSKDEKETAPKLPFWRNTIGSGSVPTTVQIAQAPVSLEKSKDEKETAPKLPSWRNTIGSGSVPTTVQKPQSPVSSEKSKDEKKTAHQPLRRNTIGSVPTFFLKETQPSVSPEKPKDEKKTASASSVREKMSIFQPNDQTTNKSPNTTTVKKFTNS